MDLFTMLHRLTLALCIAVLSLAALFPAAVLAQEKTVNIYGWSDYIDPKVLEDFTQETGIRVVYDAYDNSDVMVMKMLAGKTGYDIVVANTASLHRFILAGVLMPIEGRKLSSHINLSPEIMERLKLHDPGNRFAVPYLWGTIGVGINVASVKKRLGGTVPDSWQVLLDPQMSNRLKDCGIHVLDSPEEVLPAVLRALKLDPNSKNPNDILKAGDALSRVRGNVRKFHASDYINALVTGEICMAVGLSSDIQQARKRAKEARNGVEIAYIIPKEGAQMWFDSIVIPRDAPNPEPALSFINYMLRPDIAAANANFTESASANKRSQALMRPDLFNNPGIYPADETMKRLFANTALDENQQRTMARAWLRAKTGK